MITSWDNHGIIRRTNCIPLQSFHTLMILEIIILILIAVITLGLIFLRGHDINCDIKCQTKGREKCDKSTQVNGEEIEQSEDFFSWACKHRPKGFRSPPCSGTINSAALCRVFFFKFWNVYWIIVMSYEIIYSRMTPRDGKHLRSWMTLRYL